MVPQARREQPGLHLPGQEGRRRGQHVLQARPPRRVLSVAVVIATRDRRDVLLRTLAHLTALPERPDVVVVDNGSSDGSPEAAAAAGAEVIRLPGNRGGAARNVGMRAVRARYVALCDDDSWWAPGALSRAADLLDRHPRLVLVNAHILVGPDERLDPVCAEMARGVVPREHGQPGHALLSFIACGVVLRRAAVLEAGGFPARFGIGGEEELLAWDLAAAGWLMSYVPSVVAHHYPPPNDGRPERRARTLRNALWVAWLRRPAATAAVRTAQIIGRSPRDRHTARGVAEALRGLPWVSRERRVNPPHVEATVRRLEGSWTGGCGLVPAAMTGHHLEIVPLSRHHWVVRYEGDVTPLSEHATQAEARVEARNWARQFGEPLIHVHELDGGCHDEPVDPEFRAPTAADVKGPVVEP